MRKWTRLIFISALWCASMVVDPPEAKAIPMAQIIDEAVKKVLRAYDLMIQRLQTKTIWLQNAQKTIENELSKLKLREIADWGEKHRKLYAAYFDELWKIKNALQTYQRVRQIIDRQVKLVNEYKRAWTLVSKDRNFTEKEIQYMYKVYSGILKESMVSLDELITVTQAFRTQMSDAQRLAIIARAGDRIEQNFLDLLEFNMQAGQLSMNRAKSKHEIETIRKLYGL